MRHVGKYLQVTPEIALVYKQSYPGMSFQEQGNRSKENGKRDVCTQQSILEVCSDSDWAADRQSRQSASCGLFCRTVVSSTFRRSARKLWLAATSILSEAVFLKSLLERSLGIGPKRCTVLRVTQDN